MERERWQFRQGSPNATVSVLGKNGDSVRDAVVELKNPRMTGDQLTFDVRVLEGDLSGGDGPAAVFIDIIGLPWTPLSVAGVARRSARRAAWYVSRSAVLCATAGVLSLSAARLPAALLPPLLITSRQPKTARRYNVYSANGLIMRILSCLVMTTLLLAACAQQPTQDLSVALKGIEKSRFLACSGPPVLELPQGGQDRMSFVTN